MPVEAPLHRHVEDGVEDADGLGALQHQGDLGLARDQCGRLLGRTHGGRLVNLDAAERDAGIGLHQVHRALTLDPDAGRVGADEELPGTAVDVGDHQEQVAVGTRLDPVLDAVDAETAGRRRRGDVGLQGIPLLARFVPRPRRAGLTGDQRLDDGGVPVGIVRVGQSGEHRADRM